MNLGFSCCLSVDREGRSGGLAVLWKDPVKIQVINFARNYINLEMHEREQRKWRLTGFHGLPESTRRRESWNLLRSLAGMSDLPWCIIRDFNDLLAHEEKGGECSDCNGL